ncbi:MAG: caspase family protein [Anaerolineales bacterium]|nr:caspase family protein [Anaerolineales bacterium]
MTRTHNLLTSDNSDSHSESKVALVIGNSLYEKKPLRNPANDAADMASVLRTLAFDVQFSQDLKRNEMHDAISEYGKCLYGREVGLFYYAGHGIQAKGKNYLIPIDAQPKNEAQVTYQSMELSFLLQTLEEAKSRMNIIILDACRDNPYEQRFRSGSGRGLAGINAQTEAPIGTYIAYSTAPDTVAEDGDARNSPYTEALMKYIQVPGLQIESVFRRVRESVINKTNGRQIPWESSSLIGGDFYFIPSSNQGTVANSSLIFPSPYSLRSYPEVISDTQAKAMLRNHGFFDSGWNKRSSGIKHTYELKQDGRIVYDHITGLMWQQAGSVNPMSYSESKAYIVELNREENDGYTDWRLPTLEEAMSLMEAQPEIDKLHINPVFDRRQRWIWTADLANSEIAWFVHFVDGFCNRDKMNGGRCYVRAVRQG